MNYGCISQKVYDESKIELNNTIIENKIKEIINTSDIPMINYEHELTYIYNVIKGYTTEERDTISQKYDNVLEHFLEINKNVDIQYVKFLHRICNKLVSNLKIKFNISRPFQSSFKYGYCIHPIGLISTHTPSLPSGHTALYYLYYLYFSKIDSSNEKKYKQIYENGAKSRIIAGVHYKIDNDYSIYVINKLKEVLYL